jgi:hypothetical protein
MLFILLIPIQSSLNVPAKPSQVAPPFAHALLVNLHIACKLHQTFSYRETLLSCHDSELFRNKPINQDKLS